MIAYTSTKEAFIAQLDGTQEELEQTIVTSFPCPFDMLCKIRALAEAGGKSKAFVIRGLILSSLDEIIPRMDHDFKQRYVDAYQRFHLEQDFTQDSVKGKK